jgi:hypothetical protein
MRAVEKKIAKKRKGHRFVSMKGVKRRKLYQQPLEE